MPTECECGVFITYYCKTLMCDYSCDVYISDSVKLYTFLPFLQFSTMVTWGCAYPAQITPMIVQITPMPKRPLPDLFSALSFRIFFCSSIICSSVYPVYFLLAISVYMCYLLSMFFESPDLTFGSSYFYRNCFFPKLSLLFLLFSPNICTSSSHSSSMLSLMFVFDLFLSSSLPQ